MNSSLLNASMTSCFSGVSSLQQQKKKGKEDTKSYLQTWNVFYKEFDEDRYNKAISIPWFSRASIQVSPQGVDRRFIGVFFSCIERHFLNLQTRNIIAICNSITAAGTSDEYAVSIAKQDLLKLVSDFNSTSMGDISFSRFTTLHEELHRLIGWSSSSNNSNKQVEQENEFAENFSRLAKAFFTRKFQESQNNAARSGGEWVYPSVQLFLEKFDKDKAVLVSSWMKMPIKVLVAKPEKIQILCDKNGGAKENLTKIDKQILLVEDSSSGAVHIGYDCSAERLFRFFMQAQVVAVESQNAQSIIKRSDQLELANSSLSKRVTSDCSIACEQAAAFATAAEKDLSEMKNIFNQMAASWLKTIGMVKNYILPAVGIISSKKDTFLRALDAQASILEQVSLQFGTQSGKIEEIHEKYIVKHSAILKGAVEVDPLKVNKGPQVAAEPVQVISTKKQSVGSAVSAATKPSSVKSGQLLLHKGGKTIEQLIYSDQEDTSQWTMKKVLDEARNGITMVECAICCDVKKSSEFWHAKCTHVYCFDCLKEHIQSRIDEGKRMFSDLTCCMCTLPLEPKELYAFLSPKIQSQIDDFYANMKLNFLCPNEKCGTSSNISSKTIALNDGFITNCCGQHVCSKCKGKYHGSALCPQQTKDLIESVSVFRDAQTSDAARMFRFCPICAQLAFKDAGCNHVRCIKCSTEFCFQCSAPRHSILGHGNHYHRKGCPDFAEFIDKKSKKPVDLEFDVKKCTVCAKVKLPCKRPIEWNDFNQTLIDKIGVDVFNSFPDNFIL